MHPLAEMPQREYACHIRTGWEALHATSQRLMFCGTLADQPEAARGSTARGPSQATPVRFAPSSGDAAAWTPFAVTSPLWSGAASPLAASSAGGGGGAGSAGCAACCSSASSSAVAPSPTSSLWIRLCCFFCSSSPPVQQLTRMLRRQVQHQRKSMTTLEVRVGRRNPRP